MIVSILLLAVGVPIIFVLAASAGRRARNLSQRIAEVQEEMARDPRPPFAALADLLEGQDRQDKEKKAHG